MRYIPIALISLAWVALAQEPVSADSVFVAAVANLKAAKFADAEAGFRTMIEIEPDRLRGYLGMAQVYMAQKQADEAIGYLRAEADKMPDRLDLQVALGDTAVRTGRYDLAFSVFNAVLTRLDAKAAAELDVPRGASGATLLPNPAGDPIAESLQVLTARDFTPKGAAGIHLRLAEVFRLTGDHTSAIAKWEKISELLPKTGWILANLAVEQEADGRLADAMKSYRESLAEFPNNAAVLNNLAFLVAETKGDLYEALRYARRAGILAPGSTDILDTQGWIALKQGFLDDAVGTFVRVLQKEPGKPEFRRHLAMALRQRGALSPSMDGLVKALESAPVAGDNEKILELLRSTANEGK